MLGVVVLAVNDDSKFDDVIYHKFRDRSVLEYTIDNALQVEQAQKVILVAPSEERKNINGGGIYQPIVKPDRKFLGRSAKFYFYNSDSILSGLYQAALNYGLDHIALIQANRPILPAWLINSIIYEYMSHPHNGTISTFSSFPKHILESYSIDFRVQVFPFWVLADYYLFSEDQNSIDFLQPKYKAKVFNNRELNYLPSCKHSLTFNSLNQIELFDFILLEMSKGADLGELIEEINESQTD